MGMWAAAAARILIFGLLFEFPLGLSSKTGWHTDAVRQHGAARHTCPGVPSGWQVS
jgi:hypothetical protein